MPSRALFFLHIIKAAGTSLRYHLKDGFRSSEMFPVLVPGELTPEILAQKHSARFITGHFGSTFVDDIEPRPLTIAVLREPVAREISQYAMFCRDEEKYARKNPFAAGQRWQAMSELGARYLTTDGYVHHFDNMQCRLLAGGPWWKFDEGARTSRETLDRAKASLQQTAAFGLMENMTRSVQLIEQALGWPHRPIGRRMNVRPEEKDARVSAFAENVDAIRAANALDMELYAFARTLFEQRWKTFQSSDTVPAQVHANVISSDENYPAGDGLLPQGFGPSFFYKPVDREIRWLLLRETGRLHLPIVRGRPCAVEIDLMWPANATAVDDITARVEGAPVPLVVERVGGKPVRWRLSGHVVPSLAKSGLVAMDIVTPPEMNVQGKRGAFCLLNVRLQPQGW